MKHILLLATFLTLILSTISCSLFPTGTNEPDEPIILQGKVNLSTFRNTWKIAATPVQVTENYTQGKIIWHRPVTVTPINEIYDRETNGTMRTFRMIFRPDTSNTQSWAGITTSFAYQIPEKSRYFEIRAKGTGIIHLDFGIISEDINGNNIYDTEDRDRSGFVDEDEDTGLDGLADQDEPGYDPITNPDPNGDNWYSFFDSQGKCPLPNNECDLIDEDNYYNPLYYEFLNGTEGNIIDGGSSRVPDEEKFGNQFYLENNYLTCKIDLVTSPLRIDSTERNGWYTYRIPLGNSYYMKNLPGEPYSYFYYNKLKHIRVWFEADQTQTKPDTVEIAHWRFEPFIVETDNSIQPDYNYIRDYEYVERRIFDLLLPFEPLKATQKIRRLIMFESVPSYNANESQLIANFYVNPNNTLQYRSESMSGSNTLVKQIPYNNYSVYFDLNRNNPYVVFNKPHSKDVAIGYWMEIFDEITNETTTIGNLNDSSIVIDTLNSDTMITALYTLKLLAPSDDLASPVNMTWQLMWRNCYEIPKGVSAKDLHLKILKGFDGRENSIYSLDYQGDNNFSNKYLSILGLDLKNIYSGINLPDGIVDENPYIFRADWGLLIFPSRTPFDDTVGYIIDNIELPELEVKVPELYDYTSWSERIESSQYFIRFEWPE